MRKSLIVSALVLAAPCAAQSTVSPGTRVRVEAPNFVHGRIDGTVVAPVIDSLTLDARGRGHLSIPISAVTRLDAYRGRSVGAGVRKGATWGAIVGVPLGLFICGFADRQDSYAHCVPRGIAVEMILSGSTGALIGAGVRADQWEEIPVPRPAAVGSLLRFAQFPVHIAMGRQRRGLALGVSASLPAPGPRRE